MDKISLNDCFYSGQKRCLRQNVHIIEYSAGTSIGHARVGHVKFLSYLNRVVARAWNWTAVDPGHNWCCCCATEAEDRSRCTAPMHLIDSISSVMGSFSISRIYDVNARQEITLECPLPNNLYSLLNSLLCVTRCFYLPSHIAILSHWVHGSVNQLCRPYDLFQPRLATKRRFRLPVSNAI